MQIISDSNRGKLLARGSKTLRIIALGDSIIYGYGDYTGGGWVERLRRKWMAREDGGHILYNLGIRGDTAAKVSQRLEAEFRRRGELLRKEPDLIILSVGVNDSPRKGKPNGKLFTEFASFEDKLARLLDTAADLSQVLFVGMVPVDESKMPFSNYFYFNRADQYRYKQATKEACQQRNIPYLDIFDLWTIRGEEYILSRLASDGLHPNVKGYETILEQVLSWQPFRELS
ncbi:MAG: GDSL-type esterase/lipase family protein [Prochloraceae cyanobacterium]